MKTRRYPYVQAYVDNRGATRRYFRRKGVRIALPGAPGSNEFEAAYAAALAGNPKSADIGPRTAKGTLAALTVCYYRSPEYLGLKPITQRTYRSVIEPLREKYGDRPVNLLERRHIKKLMADQSGPGAANKLLRYVRLLLEHAVELEWISNNPARGIKKMRIAGEGFAEWPEAMIEKFEAHWPLGSKPRLAFDLLLYTGQRRSDVVTMMRSHVRDGAIRVVQQKTGQPLWLPIHTKLSASIDAALIGGLAFLETEYGRPFSAAGFGNWFRDKCDAAGIAKGFSAHGLRKAAGRRLAEAGCTAHEIMAVLGHKSLAEAARYTRGADQKRNAEAALEKISGRTDAQQKVSSVASHVSSKGAK
ncbi:MAG: tyrosine-type recombinase/integrase [Amphiplicatus sp.]|nr:tyrosine-type recombinase/integrase [Amphiplicatus sp.]